MRIAVCTDIDADARQLIIFNSTTVGCPFEIYELHNETNTAKKTRKLNFYNTMETGSIILKSSTSGSDKQFKITVDDSGTLSATEVV